MRRLGIALAALLLALGLNGEARAEHLVVALSTHQVQINSSFVGTDLVLFGAIERDEKTVARSGGYDIVVRVTGPPQTEVTRRKSRVLGIWVNSESRVFLDAPGGSQVPDEVGRAIVVHAPVPEDVAQGVEVRQGVAVERQAADVLERPSDPGL